MNLKFILMEKAMYKVVYNRKNKLNKEGKALIQIEAYLRGKKKYFSTNIYIQPNQWDFKHRQIKNHPNKISLNKQLRDFITSLENAEMEQRQSEKPFSLEYLKEYLDGNNTKSFTEFFKSELNNDKKINLTTVHSHKNTLNLLKGFKSDISFKELNYEFLHSFENYLRESGLQQNTISKQFSIIRRYINRAIDKELFDLSKYPFRKFKIRAIKTERIYLTPEEIKRFESLVLSKKEKKLQVALDLFLFAIYTGLRYSDIINLKPTNLTVIDGKEWLSLKMKKTNDIIRLPIYTLFDGKALDILYKYVGDNSTVFPFRNNKMLNFDLKEITKKLGIKKHITFHIARHTTATYLLYKGVSITTVKKLLGHRRIETTQIYSKVMDMTMINELKNISY